MARFPTRLCDVSAAVETGLSYTTGSTLMVSGFAKLTPIGRKMFKETAFGELLPSGLRPRAEMCWMAVAAAESVTGLGLVARSRWARAAAPSLSAAAVMYAIAASKRAPQSSCGCMGALSKAPASESLPRAWLMLAFTAPSLCTALLGWRHERRASRGSVVVCGVSGAAILWSSPERHVLQEKLRTRQLAKQLRDGDRVLRELHASRSWKILQQYVDPDASPVTWFTDGTQYIEFPAASKVGDASVAFMAYQAGPELRIRGVLAREDTRQILIKT